MIDDIVSLVKGRSVIVDACVSREIVRKLTDKGITARHVTDLDPQMTDDEIAQIMLPDDVLVTKDVDFARSLKERAILLPLWPNVDARPQDSKKRRIPRIKLPRDVKLAAKESVTREMALGLLHLKILCGVLMIFDARILSLEELKDFYRLVRAAA